MRNLSKLTQLFGPLAKVRYSGLNLKRSLLVVLICGVVIWDILTNGSIQKKLTDIKKYGKAAMILIIGLGVLLMVNKPEHSNADMITTASHIVSAMPASSTTRLMRGGLGFMANGGGLSWPAADNERGSVAVGHSSGIAAGGSPKIKARSVSEARKKAVAASQGWRCSACNDMLSATYEVDHIVELQDGGSNEISNLTAMCRNCHGEKTLQQRLSR